MLTTPFRGLLGSFEGLIMQEYIPFKSETSLRTVCACIQKYVTRINYRSPYGFFMDLAACKEFQPSFQIAFLYQLLLPTFPRASLHVWVQWDSTESTRLKISLGGGREGGEKHPHWYTMEF